MISILGGNRIKHVLDLCAQETGSGLIPEENGGTIRDNHIHSIFIESKAIITLSMPIPCWKT
jgi:hypothetical protein